ncbi:hypothetical protein Tco_0150415 [Tanacetum coccineum]
MMADQRTWRNALLHPPRVMRGGNRGRHNFLLSISSLKHVMAAPVISISSDISVESLGSSFQRVILIGSIFVEVLVTPEVGVAAVASPVEVLELDTH